MVWEHGWIIINITIVKLIAPLLGPTGVFSLFCFIKKAHKINPAAVTSNYMQKQIAPLESRQFVESHDALLRVARMDGFVQCSSKVTSLGIASIKIFFIFVNIESTQEDTRRVTKWGVSEDVNDMKKSVPLIFKP